MCLALHTNNSSELLLKKVTHEFNVRWIGPDIHAHAYKTIASLAEKIFVQQFAKVCETVHICIKVCQTMKNCAKLCITRYIRTFCKV